MTASFTRLTTAVNHFEDNSRHVFASDVLGDSFELMRSVDISCRLRMSTLLTGSFRDRKWLNLRTSTIRRSDSSAAPVVKSCSMYRGGKGSVDKQKAPLASSNALKTGLDLWWSFACTWATKSVGKTRFKRHCCTKLSHSVMAMLTSSSLHKLAVMCSGFVKDLEISLSLRNAFGRRHDWSPSLFGD